MGVHEQAAAIIQRQGPLLPVQITKQLNMNILFSSAILAELVDKKQASVTHAKIGNSHLYYVAGQEVKLGTLLYDHLNQREREAYDLLREYKILVDADVGPVLRVALRELKDFAIQFSLRDTIFWRFYLVSAAEAQSLAETYFTTSTPEVVSVVVSLPEIAVAPPTSVPASDPPLFVPPTAPVVVQEPLAAAPPVLEEPASESIPTIYLARSEPALAKTPVDGGKLYQDMLAYFAKKEVIVLSSTVVRKNADLDFTVQLPSALGPLPYYVKVKAKSSITENDVSLAFSQSQVRHLPGIFLVKGKLTKKAKHFMESLQGKFVVVQL